MPKTKTTDEKIVIRGLTFSKDYFKPLVFDECALPGIISSLTDIGKIARERADKGRYDNDSLVNNSPLFYIEGLLRYQLNKIDDELPLDVDDLITPSDFLHGKGFIHSLDYVCNSKVVFLFDFLDDIVTFSHYPDQLDEVVINRIALNLRALSFLVESQLTGAIKPKDIAFERFAYIVWQKMGANEISAKQFWDRAVSILSNDKNAGEVTFEITQRSWEGDRTDTYVIRLETIKSKKETNKPDRQVIKSLCESKDISARRAIGFSQIKNIWREMQNNFMERKK